MPGWSSGRLPLGLERRPSRPWSRRTAAPRPGRRPRPGAAGRASGAAEPGTAEPAAGCGAARPAAARPAAAVGRLLRPCGGADAAPCADAGITRVSSGARLPGHGAGGVGVPRRSRRLVAVQPVVLRRPVLGTAVSPGTISHGADATVPGMTDHESSRPPSYARVSPRDRRPQRRGEPARQRPRWRDHEARRLHRRRGGVAAQRRSGGHRRDGRDGVPAPGARRRHRAHVGPGELGGPVLDGDRRPGRGAAVERRLRPPAARRVGVLRLRRDRRRRRAARRCPALAPETPDEVRRMREAEIRRAHRLAKKHGDRDRPRWTGGRHDGLAARADGPAATSTSRPRATRTTCSRSTATRRRGRTSRSDGTPTARRRPRW